MAGTRFMVVERFKPGATQSIYTRFNERGRMLPDGLRCVDSWISAEVDQCFQLMECDDERLFDEWIGHWRDLVDFQIVRVVSTDEARWIAVGPAFRE